VHERPLRYNIVSLMPEVHLTGPNAAPTISHPKTCKGEQAAPLALLPVYGQNRASILLRFLY
jgi:hypothetical protein